ncbi:helix-turn-helix domain-containing protein [Promicromonospora sp. NPDC060204]|uniref:helix-turn-helix domain-containing protein n=1 Tax=Promicromonospora sp. NPDC060204 TaxID=3347071 RepID=UPI00364CDC4D
MSLLTVGEAAERLGISPRQVQHLVAQGHLRQIARGVVDETSVDRVVAVRGTGHGRAWAEPTAWGAVAILSGSQAEWMGASQRSRLRTRLRGLSSTQLVERARNRAVAFSYAGHPASLPRLRGEIVDTSPASAALGLAATATVDGYVTVGELDAVVHRHGLVRDDDGQVTLRATSMDLAVVRALAETAVTLAALDLAGSLDSRGRHAGLAALDRALERL